MLRALIYLGVLAVVCSRGARSKPSEEHRGMWGVEVRTDYIGRMRYEDSEVILFTNQAKPTDIFFTPFPRVDPSSSECHENILSGSVQLTLSVQLFSPQLIAAIRAYLKHHLSTSCTENQTCHISLLPINAIRLVHRGRRMDQTRPKYTVNDEWYYYSAALQSIEFPIYAASESACEHLLSSIVKRCHQSNFELQYSIHSTKTIERTIDITMDQIDSTAMFNKIRSRFPGVDTVALTGDDFKQLLSDIVERVIMQLRVKEGVDSVLKDRLGLERALKQQLQYKQIRLTDISDQQWESLYWTDGLTRPDRLAKAMNRIIRKSTGDASHFLYDCHAAQNAHELDLSENDRDRVGQLDRQLANDAEQTSFAQSGEEQNDVEEQSGELDSVARDESAGSGKTEHRPWNVIHVQSDNGTLYTLVRADVNRYLRELSNDVHLDEDLIVVKPIVVHRIKLSTLRNRTRLFSHPALVRIPSKLDVLPLRCPPKSSGNMNTTNDTLQLEDKLHELTSTVERLTTQSSQCSRDYKELDRKVQQLTNQSSQYDQERQELQKLIAQSKQETAWRKWIESKYHKWNQHAATVAGGNGYGQQLNQLYYPYGISVDQNKTILIADFANHRVVQWKSQATIRTIVAGGNGQGNRTDQLNGPTDVLVDKHNHSIIVADYGNRRVIRWWDQSQAKQQILIDNIDCWGLALDNDGFLYMSDYKKDEVRRWKEGERQGTLVAAGNGRGSLLNQLNNPTFLFVDDKQSVYVSDTGNHRVMKWRKGAKEGVVVAGGNGEGARLNQLSSPRGVIVDRWGQIYVADTQNLRIMRWREGERDGEIMVGGNGKGVVSNQLSAPEGLSFDDEGNLYVADYGNHRIQKFDFVMA